MNETEYSNREIDRMFGEVREKLDLILSQTTRHNGRMTRMEKMMLVAGTAILVLLVVNGSSLVGFIMSVIK